MQKIKPFLWFDMNAEEAVNFYASVLPEVKILTTMRCGAGGPWPAGTVLTIEFEMLGVQFVALNGGPGNKFTDAVSFVVPCETQAEIDGLWEKFLSSGGQEVACGWIHDKFGLSWQITPANIGRLLAGEDAEGGKRAMQAMMQMKKLDIAELERAGGLS
ncbi:MAG TPA: VOC family protein [Acidobacteriaceae bacterium]|jgi:predicted 3-demethylubiquinone-9 3-methyltransferase (glyoxalase superfamily)|nr:VOC family protein [Acidobacteriaceae bacterium]